MKTAVLFLLMSLATPVLAKLPPPTPEEAAAAAAKKAQADAQSKQAAELLAKAQDRAVENYRRNLQAGGAEQTNASRSSPAAQ